MRYSPRLSVTTLRERPLSALVTVTVTPGSTAPLSSCTVPSSVPPGPCAPAPGALPARASATPSRQTASRPAAMGTSVFMFRSDSSPGFPSAPRRSRRGAPCAPWPSPCPASSRPSLGATRGFTKDCYAVAARPGGRARANETSATTARPAAMKNACR